MALTYEEVELIEHLTKKLASYDVKNLTKQNYYEAKNSLKDLRISLPPQIRHIETCVGWANTVVNILEERLDLEGFNVTSESGNDYGVQDIFRNNNLDTESSLAHLDALIYGVSFIVVGTGNTEVGEANPLITVESPFRMTGEYSLRQRRLTSALLLDRTGNGKASSGTLFLENETINFVYDAKGNIYEVDRDVHNLGRVPVVKIVNMPRSSDTNGKSELTRSIISHIDAAIRTLAGSEIAREFAVSPQKVLLGHDESIFKDEDGNPINPLSAIFGRLWGVPYNDKDGVMPQIVQLQQGNLSAYFEQLKALAQLIASDAAIPVSYLGYNESNPASADAIRAADQRLTKRAERRSKIFGRSWEEAAKLAILVRDGKLPEENVVIKPIWRDPSPTARTAAANEALQLVQAGILTSDSDVTYRRIGLTDVEREIVKAEKRKLDASLLVDKVIAAAEAVNAPTGTTEASTEANNTTEG